MKLVNIANIGKDIYLFIRDKDDLKIFKDDNFYPYLYRQDPQGTYNTIDGKLAKKIHVSHPKDVREMSKEVESYQSDINHCKNYIMDKIDKFDKCEIKKCYYDIEVCGLKFAKPFNPTNPVSCVAIVQDPDNKAVFDIRDYDGKEKKLFDALLSYLAQEKFDLIYNWNSFYDWPYLWWRAKLLFGKRFDIAKIMSPINYSRYAELGHYINKADREIFKDVRFPAGVSFVDLMQWFQKITLNKRQSFALDFIAQEDLGEESWGDEDFTQMTDHLKEKNIQDCVRMWKLDQKFNMTNTFDLCRRNVRLQWEDMYFNLRVHDQRMLALAKKKNLILKSKQYGKKKEGFEAAYRHAKKTGMLFDVSAYDLSGAYLFAMIDFCLDESNLTTVDDKEAIEIPITDRESGEVKELCYVKQNPEAILPTLALDTVTEKNVFKQKLANTDPKDPVYKQIEEDYAFRKSLALSLWGVIGNKYFRAYNAKIASLITGIPRSLIHYVEDKLLKQGYMVPFVDTDAIFVEDKGKNLVDLLNELVQQWAMKNFGKKTQIVFDYEGTFKDIFIFSKCRYEGTLIKEGKEKLKTKGLESTRSDSSKYIKEFQTEFLLRLRNKKSKESIIAWIKSELADLQNKPIVKLSFPAKIKKEESEYKSIPIFYRACKASKLHVKSGERFYWCYVKSYKIGMQPLIKYYFGTKKMAEKTYIANELQAKKGAIIKYCRKEYTAKEWLGQIKQETTLIPARSNVVAFKENNLDIFKDKIIDVKKMAERNIFNKARVMFKAMNWEMTLIGGVNLTDQEYDKKFKDNNLIEED